MKKSQDWEGCLPLPPRGVCVCVPFSGIEETSIKIKPLITDIWHQIVVLNGPNIYILNRFAGWVFFGLFFFR